MSGLVDRARAPSHPFVDYEEGSWTSTTLRWVSTWPAAQHMSRRSPTPLAGWCGQTIGSAPSLSSWSGCGRRCPPGATAAGDRADPKRVDAVGGMVSGPRRHGDLGAAGAVG